VAITKSPYNKVFSYHQDQDSPTDPPVVENAVLKTCITFGKENCDDSGANA
jgi:hypothetical protein